MGDDRRNELDTALQSYLTDEDITPTTQSTYVLGKLIAIVERAESTMMDIGAGDPDDPLVQTKVIRGMGRIRELLQDIERHLIQRRSALTRRPSRF